MSPDYQPIRIPSIPEVVYDALRHDISSGAYPPGRISMQVIAERFGVSTMPVREALRRLESDGLVSFMSGRRVVVNEQTAEELEEIFAIRIELEALALRRAVPRLAGDAQAFAHLDDLIGQMERAAADYEAWRPRNQEFHLALYRPSGLERLRAMINTLGIAAEPSVRRYGTTDEGLRIAQRQHREIVDHARAGDVENAVLVLRQHLADAFDVLKHARDDQPEADAAG
jgi:DNA-binding GntR family transcriptional regulator